ncbi:MAG: hypothetical protein V3U30_04195 [Thermoplasmata archaeon]
MAETGPNRERVRSGQDRLRLARIAFHLSLWPFVLFVSFLVVLYILLIVGAVSPASSAGGTVLESIFIFVLQAVKSPAMAAPVLLIIIGFIMAIGIGGSGVDRKTMNTATWAAILAFPSLAVYAFLLFATAGIGR